MFWRLFLTSGTLVLLAIGLLGVVIVNRVERHFLEQTEETLRTRALLVGEVVQAQAGEAQPHLQEWVTHLGQSIATRITLLAADGTVLADSDEDPQGMENHAERPEVLAARGTGLGSATRFSSTLHQRMMYTALRLEPPRGRVAYVRVALPLDKIQSQLGILHGLVWTVVGATGVAALLLAFWLTRRITRPLQELTAGAAHIAAGSYGYKVYADGRDEVSALAQTFNRMSERLAQQFAQLEEDREQLRTILGGMVEGVIALDAEQRILFANERAAQLLELSAPLAAGRKLWQAVRQRGLQEIARQALATPEPLTEELTWAGPTVKSLTVHAAPLPGLPPRGAVLVLHDTSDLRRLERLRQEFVANVSHELKTPLSIIKACVETLLEEAGEDPAPRHQFLAQIDDQAERLHLLILDLISLARIEGGAEVFEFQSVPVAPVLTACLERYRARAESKQQQLEAVSREPETAGGGASDGSPPAAAEEAPAGPSGTPLAVWADEEALAQILDNLVDNALKYTPPGGRITVRCQQEDGHVALQVEDTGIGIPAPDLPRIFERFYRVDKARSRELGGTGLGLSIVKHLVQAMHGTVQASSRVGQGTTFTVRLPCPPPD
jgi:two-component system phosphate regulon sensor histidine kinase PhoR